MDSAGGACLRLIFFAGAPVRSTRLAQKGCMQLSPAPSPRSTSRNRTTARVSGHRPAPLSCPQQGSPEASAEIHAYIAARDMAMADAEGFESQSCVSGQRNGRELPAARALALPCSGFAGRGSGPGPPALRGPEAPHSSAAGLHPRGRVTFDSRCRHSSGACLVKSTRTA